MFLAAPAARDPHRPDASQIYAFYNAHGTIPVWTRTRASISRFWQRFSGTAGETTPPRQSYAQNRLRVVE